MLNSHEDFLLFISLLYELADNIDGQIQYLSKYLDKKPDNCYHQCSLGMLYDNIGEHEKAIFHHQLAYKADNTHTHSFYSMAGSYFSLGKLELCNEMLGKLVKLDSIEEDEDTLDWICRICLLYTNDYEMGKSYSKRLVENYEDSEHIWLYNILRAALLMECGENESGVAILQEFDLNILEDEEKLKFFLKSIVTYPRDADMLITSLQSILSEEEMEKVRERIAE
ncbi:MAG: hypothetical protein H6564_13050 [Lewinellaceae bacterium]|nr:hypothetical protein [Lewinellaceae bacterium]